MAELIIHTEEIKNNIKKLSAFFKKKDIEWSLITKVFSGDIEFLNNILTEDVIKDINSIGDSRLTSLKNLKKVNPDMRTIYIKPPAKIFVDEVVKYADVSLNSSLSTILALNEEAKRQKKIHRVIIMLELGELREGVNRNDIMSFYEKVFELSNVQIIGIGSNLGCMYGVEPTFDKLMQLTLYKELISTKHDKNLPFISGGSSITLPLIDRGIVPKEINHFRIGEAVFFGTSPLENRQFMNLSTSTFEFHANIIELEEKKNVPDGIINTANIGHTASYETGKAIKKTYKAILDFGMLDVDKNDIEIDDKEVKFVGITSDMMVLDIGKNKTKDGEQKYHIGDVIKLTPNYMAVARLLNSKFIDKKFI
ncbi:MAG: alanine racemase [Bacteroidota bacterium]|nr:alanine racemase [Bacteroidota bacterium]